MLKISLGDTSLDMSKVYSASISMTFLNYLLILVAIF